MTLLKKYTDEELLEKVLESEDLGEDERLAFQDMAAQVRVLSPKQRAWVRNVADELGIQELPPENIFSAMSEKERREHAERAKRVQMPWEREGYKKALRPPRG